MIFLRKSRVCAAAACASNALLFAHPSMTAARTRIGHKGSLRRSARGTWSQSCTAHRPGVTFKRSGTLGCRGWSGSRCYFSIGRGPSLEAGLLQQIDFRVPEREFYVLTHRERHPSKAARAFLEMLSGLPTAKRSLKHPRRSSE
jgi:DNA-binding transcriptional LysR family regulator